MTGELRNRQPVGHQRLGLLHHAFGVDHLDVAPDRAAVSVSPRDLIGLIKGFQQLG